MSPVLVLPWVPWVPRILPVNGRMGPTIPICFSQGSCRQWAGVAGGNTQALGLHQLAEGYFSPALGSLGQGGTDSWRWNILGMEDSWSNEVLESLE